jgi:hypothetical protein
MFGLLGAKSHKSRKQIMEYIANANIAPKVTPQLIVHASKS